MCSMLAGDWRAARIGSAMSISFGSSSNGPHLGRPDNHTLGPVVARDQSAVLERVFRERVPHLGLHRRSHQELSEVGPPRPGSIRPALVILANLKGAHGGDYQRPPPTVSADNAP